MLSDLPDSRVFELAGKILPPHLRVVRRLRIDPEGISVLLPGAYAWVLVWEHRYDDPKNHEDFLSLIRTVWDGDVDDLMKIEFFPRGYLVETRTDVRDEDLPGYFREVRVGRLV